MSKLTKKEREKLDAEMARLYLTRERLEAAFVHILGPEYCDFLGQNLTSKHNASIMSIFMNEREKDKNYLETVQVIRASFRDLSDQGQYTFIDE